MKNLIALTMLLGESTLLCAQKPAKTPATDKPVKSEMYRKGWIDFNKNGVKDVYEDPSAPLEARIENLLQQMTLEDVYKRQHRGTPQQPCQPNSLCGRRHQ